MENSQWVYPPLRTNGPGLGQGGKSRLVACVPLSRFRVKDADGDIEDISQKIRRDVVELLAGEEGKIESRKGSKSTLDFKPEDVVICLRRRGRAAVLRVCRQENFIIGDIGGRSVAFSCCLYYMLSGGDLEPRITAD